MVPVAAASAPSLVLLVGHVWKRERRFSRLPRRVCRPRPPPRRERQLPVVPPPVRVHQRHDGRVAYRRVAHEPRRGFQVLVPGHDERGAQAIGSAVELFPQPSRARLVGHVHLEHVRGDGVVHRASRGVLEPVAVAHVPGVEPQPEALRGLAPGRLEVQTHQVQVVPREVLLEEPLHGEELEPGAAAERRPPQRHGGRLVFLQRRLVQLEEQSGAFRALQTRPRLRQTLHALVPDVLLLQPEVAVLLLRPSHVVLAHVRLARVDALALGDHRVRRGATVRVARHVARGVDLGLHRAHHRRRRAQQARQKPVPLGVAVERPSLVPVLEILARRRARRAGAKHAVERGVQVRQVHLGHRGRRR